MNGFADLQRELACRRARRAVTELVTGLDLTPRERQGLEADLRELQETLDKLERQVVQIAVLGLVGRGKSSILNALLGQAVFATGPLHGVTQERELQTWSAVGGVELVDTPGLDEVDGEARGALAEAAARRADLVLFVIAGDMTRRERDALVALRQAGKPLLLVFNKADRYAARDRREILHKLTTERLASWVLPEDIVLCAAAPLVPQAVPQPDGSLELEMVSGEPQVEDLREKILTVLAREGKVLAALNSLLFADTVSERVIQRKFFLRDRRAEGLIWNAAALKAAAVAVNPIAVLDIACAAAIDVTAILTLAKLYGVTLSERGATELLQQIGWGMGGIGAADLLTTLGLGSLKTLLGGSGVGGALYPAAAFAQAGIAGVSSVAIGKAAKSYLANGASWGPDGPRAAIRRILDTLDQDSLLQRLQSELRRKLELSRFGLD
ncbi:MAG TPA: GTP-binding protein [Cyanobacteria bacterium UBA8156]|nr:GTP-binding protein [Cyanobacteria bacterium UBA8156]